MQMEKRMYQKRDRSCEGIDKQRYDAITKQTRVDLSKKVLR
jgi:hypothetical protein